MNSFTPNNDAETLMERLLWQDWTQGRQGHGKIDGAEYTGYRALLESEGGLYLVDIGRGEYDTYLSYQDIEALFDRNVPRDRVVKVHPSQVGTVDNEMTLEELGRQYETRLAVDAEGNPLQGSSPERMQLLFRPLIDSRFYVEPAEPQEEGVPHEEFETQGTEEVQEQAVYFQNELEQILALIDEEERNGELTHSQAEERREMARLGELILVDVGTGSFDTYLTLEQANELAERTARSDNPDQTLRLYDPSLLGDFGNPSGEVAIRELEEVFARRLARGATPEPEAQKARPEDTEKALQAKQEKDAEAARKDESEREEKKFQPLLPPSSGQDKQEPKVQDIPSSLLHRGGLKVKKDLHATSKEQEAPSTPSSTEEGSGALQTPRSSGAPVSPLPPREAPRAPLPRFTGGEGTGPEPRPSHREQQKTEAAPKSNQREHFRGGPKRYEPGTRPSSSTGGASKKGWVAAMVGGGASVGGGITGFTLLRRLGDAPDLALQWSHWLHPWLDPLTQLFV